MIHIHEYMKQITDDRGIIQRRDKDVKSRE